MAENIQGSLISAMETIADKTIQNNPRDITVSAVITQCLNTESYKFTIRYGASSVVAYGNRMYAIGDKVSVLVPEGDWSKTLFIIGLDSSDTEEEINLNSDIHKDTIGYHILGGSLLDIGKDVKTLTSNIHSIIYRTNEYNIQIEPEDNSETSYTVSSDYDLISNYTYTVYQNPSSTTTSDDSAEIPDETDEEVSEGEAGVDLAEEDCAMPSSPTESAADVTGGVNIVYETDEEALSDNSINEYYLVSSEEQVFASATDLYLQADFKIDNNCIDGSFGIIFIFDFKRDEEQYQVPYYFDSSRFSSNPLSFNSLTTQGIVVPFNGQSFIRLNKVIIYSQNFSAPKIQISNIKIYPLKKAEVNNGYMINLSAENGSYVSSDTNAAYTVKAYYDNIDITSAVDFYWGIESDVQEPGKYHILIGDGYDYIGKSDTANFYVSNVEARKANVICVASYRDKIIAREDIPIYNLNHENLINLIPSKTDDGHTILTCMINSSSYYLDNDDIDNDDDDTFEDSVADNDETQLCITLKNFIFRNIVDPQVVENDDAEVDYDKTTFLFFNGGYVKGVSNIDSDTQSHNYNKYILRAICARTGSKEPSRDEFVNLGTRNFPPYGFSYNKKDSKINTKTKALNDITETLINLIDTRIENNVHPEGGCDDGYRVTVKGSNKTVNQAAMTAKLAEYLYPIKIQSAGQHIMSSWQNKIEDIESDADSGEEDSDNNTDDGSLTTITDEDGNKVEVKKNGLIYIDPKTNNRYFINSKKETKTITDGTCIVDNDNPGVIMKSNPFFTSSGNGYIIIENDDDDKSQLYFPEENGQINLSFIPFVRESVDQNDPSLKSYKWVNSDEEEDENEDTYSVTLYYNVAIDEEATEKNGGIPVPIKTNGKYQAADSTRGKCFVMTQEFSASSSIVFDLNDETTIVTTNPYQYVYKWYRGDSLTNLHLFMTSNIKSNNQKSLPNMLAGGISRYKDNSILIDEIGENEIICCKVYSPSQGYIGSSYIRI